MEVAHDGRGLALGGTKQRSVLAILLLHANEPVSVDRLVDQIWGEEPPPAAVQTVRVHVSRLRKSLADGSANGDAAPILVTGPSGYRLQVAPGELDLERFERLLTGGRSALAQGDAEGARALLDDALRLWRGPALADLAYEPFAQTETVRLEELRLAAIEERIDADLVLGRHTEVIPELETLVPDHPLRERLRAQQMLALYRSGRQAEALDAYLEAREALVEAVGAEPGPDLRELHDAILRQDPALAPPLGEGESRAPAAERRHPGWLAPAALALVVAVLGLLLLVFTGGEEATGEIPEDTVGSIDPDTGEVSGLVAVGRGPREAVAGAGSVWVANARDGTVSRIDTDTRQATTLDVGSTPTGLAFGAGSLWVATAESRSVSQIDPRTNRVVQTFEVGNATGSVAVGFGSVWVSATVDGEVVQIDLDRAAVVRRIPVGSGPTSLATGAGSVWVAVEATGTVERIDPDSGHVVDAVAVGNAPRDVAVGAGAVWVANGLDGTLSRIDAASTAVTETLRVGRAPSAVAADRGAVWVANGGSETISRVDTRRRRVSKEVAVGSSPSALTLAAGSLWTAAVGTAASHRGGTLRVVWDAMDPACRCVDPIEYLDLFPQTLAGLAYDGLVGYRRVGDAAGSSLVPNLAHEVPEPTDGGRTYVFQLRPGLRYSDGRRVRPDDFRHSIERLLRLRGGSMPPYYGAIVGAPDCVDRPATCDLSQGIETEARSRTITIHLSRPEPEFLHALAAAGASVLPSDTPMRLLRSPAPGTGPYRIVHWDPARGARLVRNQHFGARPRDTRPDGFPDAIDIRVEASARRQLADVDSGDADVMVVAGPFGGSLPSAAVRGIATRYAGQLIGAPQPELEQVFLNTREPPFDDPRVRRAVDLAVDRRALVEIAGGTDVAQLTCQFLSPGFPGYRPHCPQTLSPTRAGTWTAPDMLKARKLVAAAGAKGTPVEVAAWSERAGIMRHVTSVLRRIGLHAKLRVFTEAGEYFQTVTSGGPRPDAGPVGWYADHLSPSDIVEPNFSCEAARAGPPLISLSGFCDPAIDALAERALGAQTRDPEVAGRLWHRVDRELVRAAPVIPIFNRRGLVLVSKRADNVQWHPLWGPLLDQIWVS